jgi:hypothetical protein
MRRVVLALAMIPVGLSGVFGIGWNAVGAQAKSPPLGRHRWGAVPDRVDCKLGGRPLLERQRLGQEFQLKREQLHFMLRMQLRQNQQAGRPVVGTASRQRSDVMSYDQAVRIKGISRPLEQMVG